MMRPSSTAARYLALTVALFLASGCMQTAPLTATSPAAGVLAGNWSGAWRNRAISGRFTLQLARGSDDRLTATAVWYGLPTVRRQFTGALADGQLILGDPKTEGLTLNAQGRGVGGYSLGSVLGKGLNLAGPYTLRVDDRPLAGTVEVSKDD